MYKLVITPKEGAPPILLNENGEVIKENDYVIGSTITVKQDTLEETNPSSPGNKLYPDKHWKIYPINLYNAAPSMLPIGNVYTNFLAPNNPGHFLRYETGSSRASIEYSRLLEEFMQSQRPKKESLYSKDKKKRLEADMKEAVNKIKILKKRLDKIKVEISKSSRKHGKGSTEKDINKLKSEADTTVLKIKTLEQKVKRLEASLKPYGYNKSILPKK